jgi:imidazoleglycerol-phosphate dehydratase
MLRRRPAQEPVLRIRLDAAGTGHAKVVTGLPVLGGFLEELARAARFDLEVETDGGGGEAEVHAVGRGLGEAVRESLGRPGTRGIGSATAPSDEALAHVSLEASGRPLVVSNVDLTAARLGGLRGDLLEALLQALAEGAGLTLHVRLLHGEDTQHVLDAIGKALGLSLAQACEIPPRS